MIIRNILGGDFLAFLIVGALVGCVMGYLLWKKRAIVLALCGAVAYALCELLLWLMQPLQLMLADRFFMFGGYVCIGLAAGALCGGLLKRFMTRLKS